MSTFINLRDPKPPSTYYGPGMFSVSSNSGLANGSRKEMSINILLSGPLSLAGAKLLRDALRVLIVDAEIELHSTSP